MMLLGILSTYNNKTHRPGGPREAGGTRDKIYSAAAGKAIA